MNKGTAVLIALVLGLLTGVCDARTVVYSKYQVTLTVPQNTVVQEDSSGLAVFFPPSQGFSPSVSIYGYPTFFRGVHIFAKDITSGIVSHGNQISFSKFKGNKEWLMQTSVISRSQVVDLYTRVIQTRRGLVVMQAIALDSQGPAEFSKLTRIVKAARIAP
jgi:hypothetical protein